MEAFVFPAWTVQAWVTMAREAQRYHGEIPLVEALSWVVTNIGKQRQVSDVGRALIRLLACEA